MRKILYSPGFGAGWWTWSSNIPFKFMCEHPLLIKGVEEGVFKNGPQDRYEADESTFHPYLQEWLKECREKFGKTPYLGGLADCEIFECEDDQVVRITEYDGNEDIHTGYPDNEWN